MNLPSVVVGQSLYCTSTSVGTADKRSNLHKTEAAKSVFMQGGKKENYRIVRP
jgi:hypothetical protein